MQELILVLGVFFLSALELWAGVPAGFAMGLDVWIVFAVCALGGISSAAAAALLGNLVFEWLSFLHKSPFNKDSDSRARRVWHSYGEIGIGLLAPALTGVPLGVGIGVLMGGRAWRLFVWASVGAVLWSAILTYSISLGLSIIPW